MRFFVVFLCVYCCAAVAIEKPANNSATVQAEIQDENNNTVQAETQDDFETDLVEQGRTFVHGTLKRFMIIAPAIFFKLGIAFTLLLLVTLVAVNNGFIGFLILVVGLSSVLAKLQGSAVPLVQHIPIPYAAASVHSLPEISHHHHQPWIDRSDSVINSVQKPFTRSGLLGHQSYDSNSDLRNTGVYYRNHLSTAKVV